MKRVAIVRLSALGDVIVSASFLPLLQKTLQCQIDWFVDERFAPILQNCPYIHQLFALPLKRSLKQRDFKTLKQTYQMLRNLQEYDVVFDMQGLLKSALVARILKAKQRVGFDRQSIKEKWASLFYSQKVHIGYQEHILKRNACVLGLESKEFYPYQDVFQSTPQAKEKIQNLLKQKSPKVLLVLEASKIEKMYPLKHYLALCEKNLDLEFLVLYHQEAQKAKEFSTLANATILPLLSLDEIKALIAEVDVVIGGDTGIVHLAWAMQTPSITLYGNTPLNRFALKTSKNLALSGNENATYQKGDFSIAKISPEQITQELRTLL